MTIGFNPPRVVDDDNYAESVASGRALVRRATQLSDVLGSQQGSEVAATSQAAEQMEAEELELRAKLIDALTHAENHVDQLVKLQRAVKCGAARKQLARAQKHFRKSLQIKLEILQTESDFVGMLSTVSKVFIGGMRDLIHHGGCGVTAADLQCIFRNWEQLEDLNSRLLTECIQPSVLAGPLDTDIANWKGPLLMVWWTDLQWQFYSKHIAKLSSDIGPTLPSMKTGLGEAMLRVLPFFKIYKEFVSHHTEILARVNQLCADSPAFLEFLNRSRRKPECAGRDLFSFLIKPAQRLPQYQMLFKDLLNSLPAWHPDKAALIRCHDTIVSIARNDIQDAIRNAQELPRVLEVMQTLSDFCDLVDPTRRLVGDCVVCDVGSASQWPIESTQVHLYIFNNLLLATDTQPTSKKVFWKMSLSHDKVWMRVSAAGGPRGGKAFHLRNQAGALLTIQTSNEEVCANLEGWLSGALSSQVLGQSVLGSDASVQISCEEAADVSVTSESRILEPQARMDLSLASNSMDVSQSIDGDVSDCIDDDLGGAWAKAPRKSWGFTPVGSFFSCEPVWANVVAAVFKENEWLICLSVATKITSWHHWVSESDWSKACNNMAKDIPAVKHYKLQLPKKRWLSKDDVQFFLDAELFTTPSLEQHQAQVVYVCDRALQCLLLEPHTQGTSMHIHLRSILGGVLAL